MPYTNKVCMTGVISPYITYSVNHVQYGKAITKIDEPVIAFKERSRNKKHVLQIKIIPKQYQ